MYPNIFHFKSITISSYGIMLGLAFFLAFLLFEKELKRKNHDPELAYKLLIAVIPSAIIGAKFFHILDYWDEFLTDPTGMIFSGAGLSVYGGLIFALIISIIMIKVNKKNILEILDIASPSMALGYAVGRLGCHASGDGCYGIITSCFLGVAYPNGYIPTSDVVFPTPLFESLVSFVTMAILLNRRKEDCPRGLIFFVYLILNGTARFLVEFIRHNPKIWLNLSQAQIVSFFLAILGIAGLVYIHFRDKDRQTV